MKPFRFGVLGAAAFVGCAHAAPERLDLGRLVAELAQQDVGQADVGTMAARLGRQVDLRDGLDLAEGETVALALSPPVRAARTMALGAADVASTAGGWPAPTLSLEALGVVTQGGSPPVRVGAGVEFPIPLSDRLDAATAEADAETRAAVLAAAVEEWRVVVAVRRAWIRWTLADAEAHALTHHVDRIGPFLGAAEKLVAAGEVEPDAIALWRLASKRHSLAALAKQAEATRARLELLALLGLPGSSDVRLNASLDVAPASAALADIAEHPEARLAAAVVARAGAALQKAEADAVGDLRIGPRLTYEEGATAVGGSVSVPLGATDGTRRAIAAARAAHQHAIEEARSVVFALSARTQQALTQSEAANARLARLETEYAPLVAAQLDRMQRLVATGEFSMTALRETLELQLELSREVLAARAEAAQSLVELVTIAVPSVEVPR